MWYMLSTSIKPARNRDFTDEASKSNDIVIRKGLSYWRKAWDRVDTQCTGQITDMTHDFAVGEQFNDESN